MSSILKRLMATVTANVGLKNTAAHGPSAESTATLNAILGKTEPVAASEVPSQLASTITFAAAPQATPAAGKQAPQNLAAGLAFNSTGEQYEEFLKLMKLGKRPFRRPGLSVMQEYELWLAHRATATPAQTAKV